MSKGKSPKPTIEAVRQILMAIAWKQIPSQTPTSTGSDGFKDPAAYPINRIRAVHRAYLDARKPK